METVNKNRSVEIDLIKGLAIILMVIGHTETPAQNFIYLFHMAVFFMASGYLYQESASDSRATVKEYILRKIKSLWFPCALWTAIFSILRNVFIDLNIYTAEPMILAQVESRYAEVTPYWTAKEIIINILKGCILPGNVQVGGSLWFLATLLHISVLYAVIDFGLKQVLRGKSVMNAQGIVSAVFLLIGYWFHVNGIFLFGIVRMFSLYCLFHLGYVFRKYKDTLWNQPAAKTGLIMAGSFCLLLLYDRLGGIALGENDFIDPVFMLTASLAGWFLLYGGAVFLKKVPFLCKPIAYLGKNTLPIVILHLLAFKLVSFAGVFVNGNAPYLVAAFPVLYRGGLWWVAYTVVGIAVSLLINMLYQRIKCYVRGLYGSH